MFTPPSIRTSSPHVQFNRSQQPRFGGTLDTLRGAIQSNTQMQLFTLLLGHHHANVAGKTNLNHFSFQLYCAAERCGYKDELANTAQMVAKLSKTLKPEDIVAVGQAIGAPLDDKDKLALSLQTHTHISMDANWLPFEPITDPTSRLLQVLIAAKVGNKIDQCQAELQKYGAEPGILAPLKALPIAI